MNRTTRDNDDSESPLPERLAEALRQLYKQSIVIPPQVDEEVLDKARKQFIKKFRQPARRFGNWSAWTRFFNPQPSIANPLSTGRYLLRFQIHSACRLPAQILV
jgi:hypothetical protein